MIKKWWGDHEQRDLTYFLAVYELNHFGKAAEKCHVSQPALSMKINTLEDELGVKLFERDNKRFFHKDIGHQVAEHTKHIVSHVEAIKAVFACAQNPFSGCFKLAVFPTI